MALPDLSKEKNTIRKERAALLVKKAQQGKFG
jgi:hypothetical protein